MDDVLTPRRAARHDDQRPRRRLGLLVATLLFFGVLAGLALAATYYQGCRSAPEGDAREVTFEVPEGASGGDVVTALREEGLVNCDGFVGSLLLRGTGKASEIRAGVYDLEVGMSLDEILTVLTTPPKKIPTVELTVVEGLRIDTPVPGRDDIASVVEEQLGLSAERFRALAESGRFALPPYVGKGDPLEGFLFPKTYEINAEADVDQVIATLLAQFEEEAASLDWTPAKRLGMSPYEVVIVASLIEREARAERDRAKVSAVIHNRLREGMPLQIDATVQYALPEENRLLTLEDYEYESPYNTYLHAGLPPTPIASPGLASLEAALNPADVDYLYFLVVDPETGAHEFAETYEEFLRLKEEAGLS